MKKIILALLVAFALFGSITFAASPPTSVPLSVKVLTNIPSGVAGIHLKIENLNTREILSVSTNEFGEYILDLNNRITGFKTDYKITDIFRVTVDEDYCNGASACIMEKTLSTDDDIFFLIDLQPVKCFACQTCELPVNPFCPEDITPYETCNSCCTEKECESIVKTQYVCSDKSIVESSDECPEQSNLIGYVITSLIALVAGTGGTYGYLKIKKTTKGVILQHSHRNYVTAHSCDTIHPYQPHKKGEKTPNYSNTKNKDGKYNYIG